MSAIFAGLGAIFMQMLIKLIGYEFVSRIVVIGLKSWADSQKNEHDEEIVAAIAQALGVSLESLKSLAGQ